MPDTRSGGVLEPSQTAIPCALENASVAARFGTKASADIGAYPATAVVSASPFSVDRGGWNRMPFRDHDKAGVTEPIPLLGELGSVP